MAAIDLTTVFGNEIKVGFGTRKPVLQLTGFPGAHGLLGMHLGSRGYPIFVTGKIAHTGVDYTAARQAVVADINSIEDYLFVDPASYVFKGTTYDYVIFTDFRLLPDPGGKFFPYTAEGFVTCKFTATLLSLI